MLKSFGYAELFGAFEYRRGTSQIMKLEDITASATYYFTGRARASRLVSQRERHPERPEYDVRHFGI